MSEIVLYNNDLLREIFRYLNVEQLKETRFVSKTFYKSTKKYEEKIKLVCNLCNEFNRQVYYNYKMMKRIEHKKSFIKLFNSFVEKIGYYCCKECSPRCVFCMNVNSPDKMRQLQHEMYCCKSKCKKRCKSCRQPVERCVGTTFVTKEHDTSGIEELSSKMREMVEFDIMISDLFVEDFDIYCDRCYSY